MEYTKHLINYKGTVKQKRLLEIITNYIKLRDLGGGIGVSRGSCYFESILLRTYLTKHCPKLNTVLVEGYFKVQDLSKFALEEADIKISEYPKFVRFAERHPEIENDSELIYEFAKNVIGLRKFNKFPHYWVEVDKQIIDMTLEQFESASKVITNKNYIKKGAY